jgi:hypothetical protein
MHRPKNRKGKARSAQNALKTGLYAKSEVLVTESRKDWAQLVADFDNEYAPATPQERCLLDSIVRYEWLSRRYMTADTSAWNRRLHFGAHADTGYVMLQDSQLLVRAARLFNSARRGFAQALKQLEDLQTRRKAEQTTAPAPAPEPKPSRAKPSRTKQHPEPKSVSFRQKEILTPIEPDRTPELREIPPLAA